MLFRHWPFLLSAAVIAGAYAAYYTVPHSAPSHDEHATTPRITRATLQEGVFRLPDCPTATDTLFDECVCESSLSYPIIEGLPHKEAADRLNAFFISLTEPFRCEGEPLSPTISLPEGSTHHTLSTSFDITYEAPDYLGLRFSTYMFSGGAHGIPGISAYVIDLSTGDFLTASALLDDTTRALANEYIYKTLKDMPEGSVFLETVEKLKTSFLQPDGCTDCTLGLTPAGLEVVFGVYSVGPYASGNIVIPLPKELITHAGIRASLTRTQTTDDTAPPAP